VHPAFVAALQGGHDQFVLVGEIAVDAFPGDAGGLHQKIHASGGYATFVDQLLGDVQNDVACVVASDFVHVANSRTIVLLGQWVFVVPDKWLSLASQLLQVRAGQRWRHYRHQQDPNQTMV
jgi:hypothetical protein